MDGPTDGHVVYFIVGGPFVKVGYSNCVRHRMKAIQTGNPYELILAHTIGYPDEKKARQREKLWRDRIAEYGDVRCGEWIELERYCRQPLAASVKLYTALEIGNMPMPSQFDIIEGALRKYGLQLRRRKAA